MMTWLLLALTALFVVGVVVFGWLTALCRFDRETAHRERRR